VNKVPAEIWDSLYRQDKIPWRSRGISIITRRFLEDYSHGRKLLEIGCGIGDDAENFVDLGFDYYGLDFSESAINKAKLRLSSKKFHFVCADAFRWATKSSFDVIYEKGFFHGLNGVRQRNIFVQRNAVLLQPKGIWISVCGSADYKREDFSHGAIYLRDLIAPAEIYFEVLEVVKGNYGLADSRYDFDAWYTIFRRRQ
jgi:SAM-dependent methyltransferase